MCKCCVTYLLQNRLYMYLRILITISTARFKQEGRRAVAWCNPNLTCPTKRRYSATRNLFIPHPCRMANPTESYPPKLQHNNYVYRHVEYRRLYLFLYSNSEKMSVWFFFKLWFWAWSCFKLLANKGCIKSVIVLYHSIVLLRIMNIIVKTVVLIAANNNYVTSVMPFILYHVWLSHIFCIIWAGSTCSLSSI